MAEELASTQFVELVLTCGSWQEAQKIADELLEKRLVACAEFMEVTSRYRWQTEVEAASEVKLIMQTLASNFASIEAEVTKLHSYRTFVLQQIPITKLSKQAQKWLHSATKSKG